MREMKVGRRLMVEAEGKGNKRGNQGRRTMKKLFIWKFTADRWSKKTILGILGDGVGSKTNLV